MARDLAMTSERRGIKLGPSSVRSWDTDGAYIDAMKIPGDEIESFFVTTESILWHAGKILPCDLETLVHNTLAACHPSWSPQSVSRYAEAHGDGILRKPVIDLLAIYALAREWM